MKPWFDPTGLRRDGDLVTCCHCVDDRDRPIHAYMIVYDSTPTVCDLELWIDDNPSGMARRTEKSLDDGFRFIAHVENLFAQSSNDWVYRQFFGVNPLYERTAP